MAEAIGLVASIIAVIQMAESIVTLTRGYIEGVQDAPHDLHNIRIEVSTLKAVFESLQLLIASGGTPSKTLKSLGGEDGPVEGCRRAVTKLEKVLNGQAKSWRLWWPLKQSKVKKLFDEILQFKTTVTMALSAETSHDIKEVKTGVDELLKGQISANEQAVLDWLTPVTYATEQYDFFSRREEGTGQWLLDSPQFQKWINTSSGGSVLYCNFRRQHEQRTVDLLSSLLKQLAQGRSPLPNCVSNLHARHSRMRTRPSLGEISENLRSVAEMHSRVFIVVDALDEVSDPSSEKLLSEILRLRTGFGANVFVTSRPIPAIADRFEKAGSLRQEIRAREEDIARYVEGNMSLLPGFVRTRPELEKEIRTAILGAADGMFLLAELHLASLKGKKAPKAVHKALETLPKGSGAYERAYGKAMERIEAQVPEEKQLAEQVLWWISCAKRPLTAVELQHAVAVELDEPKLDEDNLPEVQDMVSVCAGLVTVDEGSNVIRLVHYTTQQYLEQVRQTSAVQKAQCLEQEQALAQACLTYLLFEAFEAGASSTDESLAERLQEYPFLQYAAKYWGYHCKQCEKETTARSLQLLTSKNKLASAVQVMSVKHRQEGYSQEYPREVHGLWLAAHFNLVDTCRSLLRAEPVLINQEIRDGYTAVYEAAKNGFVGAVDLLLKSGAKADARNRFGESAIHEAARRGHRDTVDLLLAHGVDVDVRTNSGRTALHEAASNGHEDVVRLLVDKRADVNAKAMPSGWTPLHGAASSGCEPAARLLLSRGADLESRTSDGESPLHIATARNQEDLRRVLLDAGAKENDPSGGKEEPAAAAWVTSLR